MLDGVMASTPTVLILQMNMRKPGSRNACGGRSVHGDGFDRDLMASTLPSTRRVRDLGSDNLGTRASIRVQVSEAQEALWRTPALCRVLLIAGV